MTARRSGGKPEVRRRVLLVGVLLGALLSTVRTFQLTALEGDHYRMRAQNQQGDTLSLAAPRGTIYDRDGIPLAASREVFSIAVAPRELRDPARAQELLRQHLGFSREQAARYVDPDRAWVPLPGRYGAEVREALDGVQGIHFERVVQRFYPNGDIARELLGPVRLDGVVQGGLELEFDSVLSGLPGRAVVRRDSRGRPLPGAMVRAVEPVPGRDLYLTIDYDLQEIAEQALADALVRTNAVGGELLLVDPNTGEVLAAVSRAGAGRARNWRAVTEPYEPGSIIKPFTVAALLRLNRARFTDSIYGEEGRYALNGRVLTDVKPLGWITLDDALRQSSNVALAKAATRLAWHEQYLGLRDFGFGSPTGVSYPSESGGLLRRPNVWSRQSSASLAIGYEMSATPLQMAMAYGALANGGLLMEPRLVREVRSRDGRVERSHAPRVVRQVMTADVAAQLRDVLIGAVEEGTGRAASVGAFPVAGKTGTVRIAGSGGYRVGAYYASFAGFFPADDPQLVIVVKLDEPRTRYDGAGGGYYGGSTAAPVTRAMLEAVLAAHSAPIDRSVIARPLNIAPGGVDGAGGQATWATASRVVELNAVAAAESPVVPPDSAEVPDVTGMPMRDGVRRLHAAGFRVRLEGAGRISRTLPEAGGVVAEDVVIRVFGEARP
ncbi:MAG TPA: penicillin-binding transpeptidase domain-containing protein [Longimicrobiales bacterium]|nr:penicillin-binding transpeptidase domain-containing protein [Longimicrobiales bacterium]